MESVEAGKLTRCRVVEMVVPENEEKSEVMHGIELWLLQELTCNALTTERKLTQTGQGARHRFLKEWAKHAKVKLAIRRLAAHLQRVSQRASLGSTLGKIISKATEKLRKCSRIAKLCN